MDRSAPVTRYDLVPAREGGADDPWPVEAAAIRCIATGRTLAGGGGPGLALAPEVVEALDRRGPGAPALAVVDAALLGRLVAALVAAGDGLADPRRRVDAEATVRRAVEEAASSPAAPWGGAPAIGRRIGWLRVERGMDRAALAWEIGIDVGDLSAIESGWGGLDAETMLAAAKGLGVEPERLADPFSLDGEGNLAFWDGLGVPAAVSGDERRRLGDLAGAWRALRPCLGPDADRPDVLVLPVDLPPGVVAGACHAPGVMAAFVDRSLPPGLREAALGHATGWLEGGDGVRDGFTFRKENVAGASAPALGGAFLSAMAAGIRAGRVSVRRVAALAGTSVDGLGLMMEANGIERPYDL